MIFGPFKDLKKLQNSDNLCLRFSFNTFASYINSCENVHMLLFLGHPIYSGSQNY